MLTFNDTGMNLQEPLLTLRLQQAQLRQWLRPAQMFPRGTIELPMQDDFERVDTGRGVFHYNPSLVSEKNVFRLSLLGRENELLALGPYSKDDVFLLASMGEKPLAVVERLNGVEVKTAIGTPSTAPIQIEAFMLGKLPGSTVSVETVDAVLTWRKQMQNPTERVLHA